MPTWPTNPEWIGILNINKGNKYVAADGVTVTDMNTIVNDLLFLYKKGGQGIGTGYTVQFISDNNVFGSSYVLKGQSITQPDITKEGFYFLGWFTTADGGEMIEFPYTPTKDVTFYAHWKPSSVIGIVGITGLTREDGILTFTDDIAGVKRYITSKEGDYVSVTNPLSDYFPFNQISEFTDEEGNVFVKYPQLWMKWELDENGNINGYKFSNGNAGEGYFIPDAFLDPSNISVDEYLPYFALGKYEMSGSKAKGFSKSGQTCLMNVPIGDTRSAARAYGKAANLYKGYQQLDFAQCTLYNLMCMMFYGTSNIQKVYGGRTGYGTVTSWSGASVTGTCDGVTGMNGWNVSTDCVKMLGIENPYGNLYKWCDGANFSEQIIYAQRYPQKYGSNGNAMGFNRPSIDGFIKFFKNGTTDKTRSYMYASEIGGSEGTYCGDKVWYNSNGNMLRTGGDYTGVTSAGLWYLDGAPNDSTYGTAAVGARLSYRPIQPITLQLDTPQNVTANGTTVSWDAVENATSYDVYADDTTLLGNTLGDSN